MLMIDGHPDNPTMTESYIWVVTYTDGAIEMEYPEVTAHTSFGVIRVDEVVQLDLMPNPYFGLEGMTFTIMVDPSAGMRPILFRQNVINVETGEHARWHVIGWQKNAPDGSNVQSLMYVSDDGSEQVILTDRRLEA